MCIDLKNILLAEKNKFVPKLFSCQKALNGPHMKPTFHNEEFLVDIH